MSRILIIEDDEDLQEGLSFSLKMDGYEAECAEYGDGRGEGAGAGGSGLYVQTVFPCCS